MNEETNVVQDTVQRLSKIFNEYNNKRIIVLGTTCAGKTTLLKSLTECMDMDTLVWGLLPRNLLQIAPI